MEFISMQYVSTKELALGKVMNGVYSMLRLMRKTKIMREVFRLTLDAKEFINVSYDSGMMDKDIYIDLLNIIEKENKRAVKRIHSMQIKEALRVANQ